MDMKKKLEDTYLPDKNARKEKVVLGLFGPDSMVTAYLLKIQKYEVIAVTVVNSWEELGAHSESALSCHLTPLRLEKLKEFCRSLNIPHQVVKLSSEFKEEVIGPWIAQKIEGKKPQVCWNCHDLRMRTLYEKMKEVGAEKLATGHYAKIFTHESHHTFYVHTSSDEQHDQSALLSRLPHDILSKLILPLSDLTRKEVLKLAGNFGVVVPEKTFEMNQCLRLTPELVQLIESSIPKKYLGEGFITNIDKTSDYGSHNGVYHYTLGDSMDVRESGRMMKGIFADYSYSDRKMIVTEESHLIRDKLMLKNCYFSEEVSLLGPFQGQMVLSDHRYVECWIYPKNFSTVSIELTEKTKLIPGEVVSIVKKKGKNSKLFLSGEVKLFDLEEMTPSGEENVPKVDPSLDY